MQIIEILRYFYLHFVFWRGVFLMKVEGIILAAGLSTRARTHKMILDVAGKTVIERCIESMYGSCSKIVVVGGHKIENISSLMHNYEKTKLVFNPDYEEGMFRSIRAGLEHIEADKLFLIPGDYPLVDKATYFSMLKIHKGIVIPRYKGIKGHPILIDGAHLDDLKSNSEYKSMRDFVDSHGANFLEVEDKGILRDIDTMEDYRETLSLIGENCGGHD